MAQTVGAGGRDNRSLCTSLSVAKEYRAGRRLLGVDDASLVAHSELAVQSFQNLHNRAGIAGAFRLWQQLQRMQLELHRIVLGHLPAVFEAQDLLQAQTSLQGPVRGLGALRGNAEAPVESRQKLLQHAVDVADAAGTRHTEFGNQPVLESSRRSLHATLCLGRESEYHLYPQLVHGPAELGRRSGKTGPRCVPEDPVPVDVEGHRDANALHQILDHQEIGVGLLLLAE